MHHSLRFVDLVPQTWFPLVLGLLALATLAVGLGYLHVWAGARSLNSSTDFDALQLDTSGSLGSWFLSLVLIASAGMAGIIYSIRRHRTDDYQGRYRVWLWAATWCFLLAAVLATNLHIAYSQMLVSFTGAVLYGDGSLWFVLTGSAILVTLGSRLLLDMRPNRIAMTLLGFAATTQMALIVESLHPFAWSDASIQAIIRFAGESFAALSLLAAMLAHARHVLLDAQGLLPDKSVAVLVEIDKPEEAVASGRAAEMKTGNEKLQAVDAPHAGPPPSHLQPSAKPLASTSSASTTVVPAPANQDSDGKKLSKAERRALKDRLMRERLERERGKR